MKRHCVFQLVFLSTRRFLARFAIAMGIAFLFIACSDDASNSVDETDENMAEPSSLNAGSEYDELTNTLKDLRDGRIYKTVMIGLQVWMAENLNYEMIDSYCYKDTMGYCNLYGRLYTWFAATTACPSGWHLPNNAEWETLVTAAGGVSFAGKKLKSEYMWRSGAGSNAVLFSARPAGLRSSDGFYHSIEEEACFWSSIEIDGEYAYIMHLNNIEAVNLQDNTSKYNGLSVRCIKD